MISLFPYRVMTVLLLLLVSTSIKAQGIVVDSELDRKMAGNPIVRHHLKYLGEVEDSGEVIHSFMLSEVLVLNNLKLNNKRQVKRYYKIANNIKKVYPIAVDIKKTIDKTLAGLDTLPDKRAKDEYMDRMEKELKKQYTPRLKKLTFSQGKLLIKLIDRQCNQTSYELIKTYMGGFKAGFYNAFASLFGASLKKEYDPEIDDRLTERCILLIESGQM